MVLPRTPSLLLTSLITLPLTCLALSDSPFFLRDTKPISPDSNLLYVQRADGKQQSSKPQNVLQVYPPVLTPSGYLRSSPAHSSEASQDGLNENDCRQVLVKHSFGFSYGHPFVGWFFTSSSLVSSSTSPLTTDSRAISASVMRLQPGGAETQRHVQGPSI